MIEDLGAKYQFTENEIHALNVRWKRTVRDDCTWDSFEEFVEWASVNDYVKKSILKKFDESKPFGPKNAFFYIGPKLKKQMQAEEDLDKPAICRGCKKASVICASQGCKVYWEWFVKNWNEKIHQDIYPKNSPERKFVWRYEHPDREREKKNARKG